uniref:Uncharacterized protein n=1 Tax=Dictyoglomus turgidum TaxID=513050 RepID=A0A7C3SR75_9BACT
MQIIFDGTKFFVQGNIIDSQMVFPTQFGEVEINPNYKLIRVFELGSDPARLIGTFKAIRPGRITIVKGGKSLFKGGDPKELIEREKAFWREREEACRRGDYSEIRKVDPKGFTFLDGSILKWDGGIRPSPVRGKECLARLWGGQFPCGIWVYPLPQALEKVVLRAMGLVDKNKLSAGQKVPLFPVYGKGPLFSKTEVLEISLE